MLQPACTFYIVLFFCLLTTFRLQAQDVARNKFDTVYYRQFYKEAFRDILSFSDSSKFKLPSARIKARSTDSLSLRLPSKKIASRGGAITYEYQFYSMTDTPYVESDISQHLLSAQWGVTAGAMIPLTVTANVRQSNSNLFRNFADIQVNFDANAFRQISNGKIIERLSKLKSAAEDSLESVNSRIEQLLDGRGRLQNVESSLKQKALEAKEVIQVPKLAIDEKLPDSIQSLRADTTVAQAKAFLVWYERLGNYADSLSGLADSLKQYRREWQRRLEKLRQRISTAKQLPSASLQMDAEDSLDQLKPHGLSRFLEGIEAFNIGRINVDHSELTIRNTTLTGVNIAHQSWLYTALTAGYVDYRFRDFYPRQYARPKQQFMMLRLGIGRPSSKRLIFSAYHGRKQWFSSASSSITYPVTGYSIEAQWMFSKQIRLSAEAGQSFSPDYRDQPLKTNYHWGFKDVSNKALFVRLNGQVPLVGTRFDIRYRFTGERFQSFSRLQSFADAKSWSVRADQSVWKRRIRLSLSAFTNDFSNPTLGQRYSTRSVMRSAQATLSLRKWPVISIGYLPLSQITRIGNEWVENNFQVLNGNMFHQYQIGRIKASTNISASKYYNRPQDSILSYYQAVNIYAGQVFYLTGMNVSLSLSMNKTPGYTYTVVEEGVNWPVTHKVSVDGGLSINQFNGMKAKLGTYAGGTILLRNSDRLTFRADRAYYPADTKMLYDRITGTIQFTKSF